MPDAFTDQFPSCWGATTTKESLFAGGLKPLAVFLSES